MQSTEPAGYWSVVWRRFKQHRVAYVGFFFFVTLLLAVIVGPSLVSYELDQVSLSERMQMPSARHWLGTDELGRDTWVRIMHGGRVSLTVGLAVALSTVLIGGLIGILAGYVGGALDNALMRLVDIIYTIPRIVLLLVLSKLAGPGLLNIIVILVALEWTNAARLARSAVLVVSRARVCPGGAMSRCFALARDVASFVAQCFGAVDRLGDARCRRGDPRRDHLEFSRSGHSAADAELGKSTHQRRDQYFHCTAASIFARTVYFLRVNEFQSAR